MGVNYSSAQNIPDNEFTVTALMLKRIGINLCVLGFQDIIESKDLEDMVFHRHVFIAENTPEAREAVTKKLSEKISESVSAFILAVVSKGIRVVINAHPSNFNGEVIQDTETGTTGYVYEGKPLVENMFMHHFGPEITKFIHVQESIDALKGIKAAAKLYRVKPTEILVIHHNPEVIREVRKLHSLGILVDDHKLGFRL